MTQEFHEATTEQIDEPSEDKSVFHDVEHLGELKPGYFPDLITHPKTSIKICHEGRDLLVVDDPSNMEITRPLMTAVFGRNRIRFRLDTVFQSVDPNDSDDEDGDTVEDEDDEDDDNTNANGYETDGKITFTLDDK